MIRAIRSGEEILSVVGSQKVTQSLIPKEQRRSSRGDIGILASSGLHRVRIGNLEKSRNPKKES